MPNKAQVISLNIFLIVRTLCEHVKKKKKHNIIYINYNLIYLIKQIKSFKLNLLILCWVCGSCPKLLALNVVCRDMNIKLYKSTLTQHI